MGSSSRRNSGGKTRKRYAVAVVSFDGKRYVREAGIKAYSKLSIAMRRATPAIMGLNGRERAAAARKLVIDLGI